MDHLRGVAIKNLRCSSGIDDQDNCQQHFQHPLPDIDGKHNPFVPAKMKMH